MSVPPRSLVRMPPTPHCAGCCCVRPAPVTVPVLPAGAAGVNDAIRRLVDAGGVPSAEYEQLLHAWAAAVRGYRAAA